MTSTASAFSSYSTKIISNDLILGQFYYPNILLSIFVKAKMPVSVYTFLKSCLQKFKTITRKQ